MIDNGLLGKYRRQGLRNGYVDLSALGYTQQTQYADDDYLKQKDSWVKPDGSKTWYHVKFSDKARTDAHVMLSQIYHNAGLKTAIYLPAKFGIDTKEYVVSQDLERESTASVRRAVLPNFDQNGIFCNKESEDDVGLTFTKNGMRDLIKARLFDSASCNFSHIQGNYIVNTNENHDIKEIGCIDFAKSGSVYAHYKGEVAKELFDDCFENFSEYQSHYLENKDVVISQIKNNEGELSKYYSRDEMARDLGSVNVQAVKDDIFATMFYKVDQGYCDMIAKSFDSFAEELSR